MAYDKVIAVVTLSGSIVSVIATTFILGCFIVFNKSQRSFRHALIFNLALSDFINSVNNVTSGAIYVREQALYPGAACKFNGWIGQLSVQATDFSILAIAISTLLVVVQKTQTSKVSTIKQICICGSVWIIPIATSTTGLALNVYVPVGDNWCWIAGDRTDLRYALTHGWRLAVIFSTVLIYAYIYWYFQRHFKSMLIGEPSGSFPSPSYGCRASNVIRASISAAPANVSKALTTKKFHKINSFQEVDSNASDYRSEPWDETDDIGDLPDIPVTRTKTRRESISSALPFQTESNTTCYTSFANDYIRERSRKTEREVRRMLLLRGYPMLYVILWIPGLVSRFLQAAGNEAAANSRVLIGLQASTQFVGFANAITYGWNQQWRRD
ncbi:G protein-coupled glucose receptor regulating Gpa2-domain-containing protein [Xylariaceae sp. FL0255]|nr:G protein-coupled glucose receptor regulating Gpa2-domain-containing protein [Xylariaceae sp. FL0255]